MRTSPPEARGRCVLDRVSTNVPASVAEMRDPIELGGYVDREVKPSPIRTLKIPRRDQASAASSAVWSHGMRERGRGLAQVRDQVAQQGASRAGSDSHMRFAVARC